MIDLTEEIDYNFVERISSNTQSVQLLTGEWAGVIYSYGRVRIKENRFRGNATVTFNYNIEDTSATPFHTTDSLNNSKAFKNHIGEVLTTILSNRDGTIGSKDGAQSTNNNHKGVNS